MWRRQDERSQLVIPAARGPAPPASSGHTWTFTCADCDTSWTVTAWMILRGTASLTCPNCSSLPARPAASKTAAEK